MNRFTGRVVEETEGRRGRTTSFPDWSGYGVAIHYAFDDGGERRLVEKRFPVAGDGSYSIHLSDNALADPESRLVFLAPSGEMLSSRRLDELRGDDQALAPVALPHPTPDFEPSAIARAAREQARVTGRLMIASGAPSAAADVPVTLRAGREGEPARAIWTGRTDRLGYFRIEAESGPFGAAALVVGTGEDRQVVDVVLDREARLPDPLIVMLELPAPKEPCDCAVKPPLLPDGETLAGEGSVFSQDLGTSCQAMTVPNRTLEEFDFIRIVRTTDPEIRGMSLPSGTGTRGLRTEMGKIVFDSGTFSQATGASEVAIREEHRRVAPTTPSNVARRPTIAAAETVMRGIDPARARSEGLDKLLREQISLDPLAVNGAATAALWRAATSEKVALDALDEALAKVPAAVLSAALEDPDGFTPDKVMSLERRAGAEAIRAYLGARAHSASGRAALNEDNRIDWDHTPEFYQATSVAHGHILHFKQEWKADGYSLGDLLKSVALAPGQQKQIVTLDWDRVDRTARTELTVATEQLTASMSHDRDINEIANANFRENLSGESSATTGAVGGGLGLAIGPLVIGGGGGSGWASSTASQDSARSFSADTMNSLRDQTSQAVSAVRNQRSTVVDTVAQSEDVTAITEVIANYNRCHALTIQYFEVLRHFAVQERLAGVSECLFVPLEMSLFDDAKALRWRELLERACADRALRRGFDAIERLSSPATQAPDQRFADDPIEGMSGRLRLRVAVARPKDPDEASRAALERTEWRLLGIVIRVNPETIYDLYSRNAAQKDRIFQSEIAPKVAREFLASLEIVLIDRDGQEHPAGFDLTVASRYQEDGIMEVVLNDNSVGDRLPRAEIAGIEIRTNYQLPEFSKVILEDARISYRTARLGTDLLSRTRVLDDVLVGDPAYLSTSDLSWIEERNKLAEDRKLRRRLLRHLNDNIEFYHRAIWLGMDANRRYMLLDGFEAPNSGGRSIASVVENRLVGVVGNCLVMPVASGFQLDPVLRQVLKDGDVSSDVLTRLYDQPPSPPRRYSVPTRGVFGEAVAGTCKSCELIEEDRFWRWSEYPLPDSPPAIAALSTDTRFAARSGLTPTPFPDALIKYQTVPDAPNPTGMAAALEILGKDVFKDLTGLSENQKNALAALSASLASAEGFAGEAVSLAIARDKAGSLDRTLAQIESAKASGYLDDAQASKAARDALVQSFGGSDSPTSPPVTQNESVAEAVKQAASSPGGKATITRQQGDKVETVAFETDADALAIGKAPVIEWIDHPLWVSVPMVRDAVMENPSGSGIWVHATASVDKIDDARNAFSGPFPLDAAGNFCVIDDFGRPLSRAGQRPFDMIQSALDAGLLRPDPHDPAKFQIKVEAKLGYPAQSSSKTSPKTVHFPHSGKRKMPLVLILHGQSRAWIPTGAPTPVTLPNGVAANKGTLQNVPNHEGFKYLQDHLAAQPEPAITLSINTNAANTIGSYVEMRALLVNEAIAALKAEIAADSKHFLTDAIDFDKVGLLGHSRGGEAVVRAHQLNLAAKRYTAKSVLALAPTDFTGLSSASRVSVDNPDTSYLMIWGGLDGDVNGRRVPGKVAWGGAGPRVYDRVKAPKALVFAPACTHNRFNNPVWKDEPEWKKKAGAGFTLDVPAKAASPASHESLLKEFAWAFFDLTLNGNAAQQALFRGEVARASSPDIVQQWRFGSDILVIDDFEQAAANNGTRSLGVNMTRDELTHLNVPAGAAIGTRERHVNHHTKACILDVAAAAAAGHASSTLHYDLRLGGSGRDLSLYHYLSVRLGQLRDPTNQASLDKLPVPQFTVRMTDGSGTKIELHSDPVYAAWKNPLAKPLFKDEEFGSSRDNVTQMVLHTFAVDPRWLSGDDGTQSLLGNFGDIVELEFEFLTGAAEGEIWIDSIEFVVK